MLYIQKANAMSSIPATTATAQVAALDLKTLNVSSMNPQLALSTIQGILDEQR